jgi:hypothetical protein
MCLNFYCEIIPFKNNRTPVTIEDNGIKGAKRDLLEKNIFIKTKSARQSYSFFNRIKNLVSTMNVS